MANRWMGLVLAALVVTLGACGDPGHALPDRPRPATGKADAAGEAASFDRLVALLKAKATVTMPPLGVDNAANELDITVTVHAAGEVKKVAGDLINEISATYVIDPATETLLDHYDDDVHVLLVSGWNDEAIQRDLLSMIAAGKRSEVGALLDGYMLHFRIYQTASEITAEEIFVYRPTDGDKALILRLSYVHA